MGKTSDNHQSFPREGSSAFLPHLLLLLASLADKALPIDKLSAADGWPFAVAEARPDAGLTQ